MTTLLQTSPKTYARLTGTLYLIIAIAGGFSMGYLPTLITASGDAAGTAQAIIDNRGLFQLGIFADMVVFLSEIFMLVALFMMFKTVSPTVAAISSMARMGMVGLIAVNVLFDIIPLLLLGDAEFLTAFSSEQINALVLLCVKIELFGVALWQIFFTAHLLGLGYLVIKSNYLPKIIGVLLMFGAFGYAIDAVGKILAVNTAETSIVTIVLLTIVSLAEISFGLWLMIKGINETEWNKRQAVAAAA